MIDDLIAIALAFIEGFALILSPCILPILPVVLAGSLAGSKQRPVGIICGFTITFAFIAFFSRSFVQYLGIDLNVIRTLSFCLLLLLGLVMLSSYLTEKLSRLTQRLSGFASHFSLGSNQQGGFLSGILLGGLVAIVWTPCAGPILAAIIVQIVIQKTTLISFFMLLAFALGASMPMFVIALYGLKMVNTFRFFKTKTVFFRKFLGGIIIASVVYMVYQEKASNTISVAETGMKVSTGLKNGLWHTYKAPEIGGISAWLNSPPLQLNHLKGKVVLVDFWTYSCINCLRTLPFLKGWYNKYHDKGLVIIGIHTPEFEFEKNLDNVKDAVRRYGITYPVALDNQFVTWRHFGNHFWPAHYLINKQGDVVYEHRGEGEYDVTENNIRFLLGIDALTTLPLSADEPYIYSETPETYLGYARATRRLSPTLVHDNVAEYHFQPKLARHAWSLEGAWIAHADTIIAAKPNAALQMRFNARKVYMVMGNNTANPIKVKVRLNNKPLLDAKGADVSNSIILVDKHSIYEVIVQKQIAPGLLEITASDPGLEIYTFTFGG